MAPSTSSAGASPMVNARLRDASQDRLAMPLQLDAGALQLGDGLRLRQAHGLFRALLAGPDPLDRLVPLLVALREDRPRSVLHVSALGRPVPGPHPHRPHALA